ncbi:hypothetical protein CBR_g88578 [Chara braunii]|uniref:Uncharacterized protein n=1 Tax=Chara braunii TaxID=69332 RepID=A0A388KB61_CHABU|nr:hypothetical protein CBR_g88578 [Chara braunii]|eukprot:GBG67290.1 hypothetical protein CBR_g88578 [Chara braunii]
MHVSTTELLDYIDDEDKDPKANVARRGLLVQLVTRYRDGKTMMDMYLANLDESEAVEDVHATLTTIHRDTRKDLLLLLRKATVYDYRDLYVPLRISDVISFGRTTAYKMFGIPEIACFNTNLRNMSPQPRLAAPPTDAPVDATASKAVLPAMHTTHNAQNVGLQSLTKPKLESATAAGESGLVPLSIPKLNSQPMNIEAMQTAGTRSGSMPLLTLEAKPGLLNVATEITTHSECMNMATPVVSEVREKPSHKIMKMVPSEQTPKTSGLEMCNEAKQTEPMVSLENGKATTKMAEKCGGTSALGIKRAFQDTISGNVSDGALKLAQKKTRKGQ